MSDILASGAAWLADQLAANASRQVMYYRGTSGAAVYATVGVSRFEAQNSSGITETWESRDYIIKNESLPFGEPQRHDLIVETLNGNDIRYEVSSPRGVAVFHYGDAYRKTIRVHTIATNESSYLQPTLLLRYWGAFAGQTITDQQIAAALSNDMGAARGQVRTITASGQYLYFVLPSSFGAPSFTINGLTSTAWETTSRSVAFTGQASRAYTIYRSTYAITGAATVAVN